MLLFCPRERAVYKFRKTEGTVNAKIVREHIKTQKDEVREWKKI